MSGQTVVVSVLADTKPFAKGLGEASSIASGFTKALAAGALAAGAAMAAVTAFAVKAVQAAGESQVVAAQTSAVLKSTGEAAGRSAKQIGDLATKLSRLSGVDDEVVQGAENMLLTFTNIKGDTFDKAAASALDMSVALKTDATSAAQQLGKALNDPVAGITKLTKIGVTFSAQQKEQIANYVRLGNTAAAQQVILDEINREFGGSAEAFGNTWQGALGKVKTEFGNIEEAIGSAFLPALTRAGNGLAKVFEAVQANPKFQATLDAISTKLGGFADKVASFLTGVVSSSDPLKALSDGLTKVAPVLALFGGLVSALGPLLPTLGSALGTLGKALSDALIANGPALATSIQQIATEIAPLLPQIVQLIPPLLQLATIILPPLVDVLSVVATNLNGVEQAAQLLAGFFSGDVSTQQYLDRARQLPGVFGATVPAAEALGAKIGSLIARFRQLADGATSAVSSVVSTVQGIAGTVQGAVSGAGKWLVSSGKAVIQGFIDGIVSMSKPAQNAVKGVMDALARFFPHSPAKEGPFSGKGWTLYSGQALGEGLASGMLDSIASVRASANRMMGSLSGQLQLATPNLAVSGNSATAGGVLLDPGPRVNVSIVQNNPVTRDPLVQLREDSERVAAGIW